MFKYDTSGDPFYENAKYIWEYEEPEDFGTANEYAVRQLGTDKAYWRKILKVKDQLFGGIKDDTDQHPGSSGILL